MKLNFNVHEVIKIPGKTFEDLTLYEISLMIDADSSISPGGNEYFASCALDEFLHNVVLKRKDLKKVQQDLLENIYVDIEGKKAKEINTDYLRSYSAALKTGNAI